MAFIIHLVTSSGERVTLRILQFSYWCHFQFQQKEPYSNEMYFDQSFVFFPSFGNKPETIEA